MPASDLTRVGVAMATYLPIQAVTRQAENQEAWRKVSIFPLAGIEKGSERSERGLSLLSTSSRSRLTVIAGAGYNVRRFSVRFHRSNENLLPQTLRSRRRVVF